MTVLKERVLFLFRNDLRLVDNTALNAASRASKEVVPLFIFNKEQIDKTANPFFNEKAVMLMLSGLRELETEITARQGKLNFFYGENLVVLKQLFSEGSWEAIFFNRDYTPYSLKRDAAIAQLCAAHRLELHSFDDRLLHAPQQVLKEDQAPYTIFTPYYRKAETIPTPPPDPHQVANFSNFALTNAFSLSLNEMQRRLEEQPKTN